MICFRLQSYTQQATNQESPSLNILNIGEAFSNSLNLQELQLSIGYILRFQLNLTLLNFCKEITP